MLSIININEDWHNDFVVRDYCLSIYKYFSTVKSPLSIYDFSFFKTKFSFVDDTRLFKALDYFCAPKWNLLKRVFFFIDSSDDQYLFDDEDVEGYLDNGYFINPLTGIRLADNEVYIAYEVRKNFNEGFGR